MGKSPIGIQKVLTSPCSYLLSSSLLLFVPLLPCPSSLSCPSLLRCPSQGMNTSCGAACHGGSSNCMKISSPVPAHVASFQGGGTWVKCRSSCLYVKCATTRTFSNRGERGREETKRSEVKRNEKSRKQEQVRITNHSLTDPRNCSSLLSPRVSSPVSSLPCPPPPRCLPGL